MLQALETTAMHSFSPRLDIGTTGYMLAASFPGRVLWCCAFLLDQFHVLCDEPYDALDEGKVEFISSIFYKISSQI